jgi:hypothetical protein
MSAAETIMKWCGWIDRSRDAGNFFPTRWEPELRLSGSQWKSKVTLAKEAIAASRSKNATPLNSRKNRKWNVEGGDGIALLDSYYFTKYFKARTRRHRKLSMLSQATLI